MPGGEAAWNTSVPALQFIEKQTPCSSCKGMIQFAVSAVISDMRKNRKHVSTWAHRNIKAAPRAFNRDSLK